MYNFYPKSSIKKICDIYDWDGKGVLDMYFFGDIVYALGHNITKKICMGLGQQEEECKKFLPFDDVVKLVLEAEKAPDRVSIYLHKSRSPTLQAVLSWKYGLSVTICD